MGSVCGCAQEIEGGWIGGSGGGAGNEIGGHEIVMKEWILFLSVQSQRSALL